MRSFKWLEKNWEKKWFQMQEKLPLREERKMMCTMPVSYTHLDVYKRQVQGIIIILLVLVYSREKKK